MSRMRRIGELARALRAMKAARERERWTPEQMRRHHADALDALVRDVVERSPFYRERFAGLGGQEPVELASLPPLDKATLMANLDGALCDPRLRGRDLRAPARPRAAARRAPRDGVERLDRHAERLRLLARGLDGRARPVPPLQPAVRHPPADAAAADRGGRRAVACEHDAEDRAVGRRRDPPRAQALGDRPAAAAGRGAERVQARRAQRLSLDRRAAGGRAARRPAPDRAGDHLDQQRVTHGRDDRADRARVRRPHVRPRRHPGGALGRRLPAPRRDAPVRGLVHRRDRRRRAAAGDEPLQPHAADDPLRGLRRRDARPPAVRVRSHGAADALDAGAARRRPAPARRGRRDGAGASGELLRRRRRPGRARVPGAPAGRADRPAARAARRRGTGRAGPDRARRRRAAERARRRAPGGTAEVADAIERTPAGKLQLVVPDRGLYAVPAAG